MRTTKDESYHKQLVFRAVGPAKEITETIKLRILEQGNLTVLEMMELEAE